MEMAQRMTIPNTVLLRCLFMLICNVFYCFVTHYTSQQRWLIHCGAMKIKIDKFFFLYFQIIDTMALHMPPEKLFVQLVSQLQQQLGLDESLKTALII